MCSVQWVLSILSNICEAVKELVFTIGFILYPQYAKAQHILGIIGYKPVFLKKKEEKLYPSQFNSPVQTVNTVVASTTPVSCSVGTLIMAFIQK